MNRKGKFSIPTLLAAGLTALPVAADVDTETNPGTGDLLFDHMKGIVTNIEEAHRFTLAQHRSHQSHSSHRSHQSHRSYSSQPPLGESGPQAAAPLENTRNKMSTPPNSILPNSPAIVKKLKILPGNSRRFRELVMRTQIALFSKGYHVGEVNGELHARMVAALYKYQEDVGHIPSGKLTNEVLSSLGIVAQ